MERRPLGQRDTELGLQSYADNTTNDRRNDALSS